MNWTVLHVRPRCEKKVAEYCVRHKVPSYLPLRSETKIYQRRKVTVAKPVFPSYVFAEFERPNREVVLKSGNIVRIIEVVDQERFVLELDQVRKALDVDPTLGATAAFTRGKRVRILDGPFRGLEGVVETVRGGTRVILNVEAIGQGVPVDVDMHMLEPAE